MTTFCRVTGDYHSRAPLFVLMPLACCCLVRFVELSVAYGISVCLLIIAVENRLSSSRICFTNNINNTQRNIKNNNVIQQGFHYSLYPQDQKILEAKLTNT